MSLTSVAMSKLLKMTIKVAMSVPCYDFLLFGSVFDIVVCWFQTKLTRNDITFSMWIQYLVLSGSAVLQIMSSTAQNIPYKLKGIFAK